MQVVIKIHERDYQAIVQSGHVPYGVVDAIMRGKVLPKGHGRLIDADEFDKYFQKECAGECGCCEHFEKIKGFGLLWECNLVKNAPTIIEADVEADDE